LEIITNLKIVKQQDIGKGEGLNSEVYLAWDPQLNASFAVKQIEKKTFWNPDCFSEAKIIQAARHNNIVPIQYACDDTDYAYLAMPYFPRGSLARKLKDEAVSLSFAIRIMLGVLEGVSYIHLLNHLHLDIKPTNVLLADGDRPMLADFGQARTIGQDGLVAAPPMYWKSFPPEALTSNKVLQLSDVFQLGLLFYRIVNGEEHFQHQLEECEAHGPLENSIIKGIFPNRDVFLPHIPKGLRRIIRKALRVDPMERFRSAQEMSSAIGRIALRYDWTMENLSDSDTHWKAPRNDGEILIDLRKIGSRWSVEVHSKKNTLRALGRDSLWARLTSRKDALAHLTDVFQHL
jgi:eukaryotic-like serine/threonine-protein kinase